MSAVAVTPLTLSQPVTGPWLAIAEGDQACADNLILVRPGSNARPFIDEAHAAKGRIVRSLTPLADFGMGCTLFPHTRVLSVWAIRVPHRISRNARAWAGKPIDRIRVSRALWAQVAEAATACNAEHGLNAYGVQLNA